MAIYQPILNSQVSGASVPQASDSFAGINAVGNALEGLVGVAGAYLEKSSEGNDLKLENEYITSLERADQLQARGLHAEARRVARDAGITFARGGGDPYNQKFKGLRANLGLGESYTMDPQEYMDSLITGSEDFQKNAAVLYQKYFNEWRAGGPPVDVDRIHEEAKGAVISAWSNETILQNERNSSAVRLNALKGSMSAEANTIVTMINGYLDEGNNWFNEDMLNSIKAELQQSKRRKYESLGPGATTEMLAEVDKWYAMADELVKNLEAMGSFEGMQETHRREQFKFLSRLALEEDQWNITPQDFNWWMQSQDGADKAAHLALTGGAQYQESMERVNSALSTMLFVTRGPRKKAPSIDYTKFDPFDAEVNKENMLLSRIDTAIDSPDLSVKDADGIINFLMPGLDGDPNSAKDATRAEQVAVSVGMASRLLHKVSESDGWVTPDKMRSIFNAKVDSYMKVIAKEHPELYVHLIDYMSANVQTYNAAVEVRRGRLSEEWGLSYSREKGWEVDKEFIAENNIWGENSAKHIDTVSRIAGDLFGIDKDSAFIRLVTNDADRAAFIDYSRQLERRGDLDKDTMKALELVKFRFSNSDAKASSLNAQGMIDGSTYLNKTMGNYSSYAQAPITEVPTSELMMYAPLMEAADIGEAGGDYDALYNFANTKDTPYKGTKVSEMTIAKVLEFAGTPANPTPYRTYATSLSGNKTAPVGRWQFVPQTLKWVAEEMGLNFETTIFNKKTQDAMFKWLVDYEVSRATSPDDLYSKLKGRWPGMFTTEKAKARVMKFINNTYSFGVEEEKTTDE